MMGVIGNYADENLRNKKKLPKQVMHETLTIILEYLWRSGKIIYSPKGVQWIYSQPEHLKKCWKIHWGYEIYFTMMSLKKHQQFSKMNSAVIKKLLSIPTSEGEQLTQNILRVVHQQKDAILKQAFEEEILTPSEYEHYYKDRFYDDYGSDSFIQYLNSAMNAKVDYFVTSNERILKIRNELETKFKLKIATPQEILQKKE